MRLLSFSHLHCNKQIGFLYDECETFDSMISINPPNSSTLSNTRTIKYKIYIYKISMIKKNTSFFPKKKIKKILVSMKLAVSGPGIRGLESTARKQSRCRAKFLFFFFFIKRKTWKTFLQFRIEKAFSHHPPPRHAAIRNSSPRTATPSCRTASGSRDSHSTAFHHPSSAA